MATEAEIVNAALQLVRVNKRISSLSDNITESNTAEDIYYELRDRMLEMHQWNWAIKRAKLAQLSEVPAFEWDYAYELPADFIRVVTLHNNDGGRGTIEYKLEDNKVLTDEDKVYLRYVSRITDPNKMSPSFRAAFSKLLASYFAVSLSNSARRSEELYDQFLTQDMPRARSIDSLQDSPEIMPESSWVTARYGESGNNTIDPAES